MMLHRISLIRQVGGTGPFIRTCLLLVASIVMSAVEVAYFGGVTGGIAAVVLTMAGWYFRTQIMELGAAYAKASSLILLVYGVVLFLAKYSGFGIHGQLVVIIIATVIMFNLNFWSISEAALQETEAFAEDGSVVYLHDSAAEAFRHYLGETKNSYIRLWLSGDADTGFTYQLNVQELPAGSDDKIDTSHGFTLAIPREDIPLIEGTTISWETKADGSNGFKFDNPRAANGGSA